MELSKLTLQEAAGLQRYVGYGASWLGPALVTGDDCWVTDVNGNRYLDCTSQAWLLALGHNHPEVLEAAIAQARSVPFSHEPETLLVTICPAIRLGTL